MKTSSKIAVVVLYVVFMGLVLFIIMNSPQIVVLNPKGIIGSRERDLMMTAALLMLLIIIPVFTMTATIAWKYRAGNSKAKYSPDWDGNRAIELAWWGLPCAIIAVLAVVTWRSAHQLDPFRPIASSAQPITIQVISLDWKWLFIYPEQHIATVNFLELPAHTPINFELTSDAPMNSFWIPQLGGQIYTMPGMSTQLHLVADQTGDYYGESANISGQGFASMNFIAKAVEPSEFQGWADSLSASQHQLTAAEYNRLAQPSQNVQPTSYSLALPDLYDQVVEKYMAPGLAVTDNNQNAKLILNQPGYAQ